MGMVTVCVRVRVRVPVSTYMCVRRTPFINFYAPYFTEVIQNVRPLYCNMRNKWRSESETMYLNYVPEAFIQWHRFTLEVDPNVFFFFQMLSPMFLLCCCWCCCYLNISATRVWFLMLFVFIAMVLFCRTRIPMHSNRVENISSSWSSNLNKLFEWSKWMHHWYFKWKNTEETFIAIFYFLLFISKLPQNPFSIIVKFLCIHIFFRWFSIDKMLIAKMSKQKLYRKKLTTTKTEVAAAAAAATFKTGQFKVIEKRFWNATNIPPIIMSPSATRSLPPATFSLFLPYYFFLLSCFFFISPNTWPKPDDN